MHIYFKIIRLCSLVRQIIMYKPLLLYIYFLRTGCGSNKTRFSANFINELQRGLIFHANEKHLHWKNVTVLCISLCMEQRYTVIYFIMGCSNAKRRQKETRQTHNFFLFGCGEKSSDNRKP